MTEATWPMAVMALTILLYVAADLSIRRACKPATAPPGRSPHRGAQR